MNTVSQDALIREMDSEELVEYIRDLRFSLLFPWPQEIVKRLEDLLARCCQCHKEITNTELPE